MHKEKKMYKVIKEEKIIGIAEDYPKLLDRYEVIEDNEHEVADFVMAENEFVLKTDDKAIAKQKNEVRRVRNSYLETYVDPKQLVMVWNSLTAEEQELYKDYRQYLLDYPQTEGWWEQNPDDWENWLVAHKPVSEK